MNHIVSINFIRAVFLHHIDFFFRYLYDIFKCFYTLPKIFLYICIYYL